MSIIFIISLIIAILFLCIQFILMINSFVKAKYAIQEYKDLPNISILLAARNEEDNIIRCLSAFDQLNYPIDKLQILVGNDQSEDKTNELILSHIKGKSQYELIQIDNSTPQTKGKARVLAQLGKKVKGEFMFITDADVAVNPMWIREFIKHFTPNCGIVAGVTIVNGKGLNALMQKWDWYHFMGMLNVFSQIKIAGTAVGNNMAIRTKVYHLTGGYEKLKFSITEDFMLFNAVKKTGWEWKNIINNHALVVSKPVSFGLELFRQRKRWLKGAFEYINIWWPIFYIYGLFFPSMLLILWLKPYLFFIFLTIKIIQQNIIILNTQQKLNKNIWTIPNTIVYELFLWSMTLSTSIIYLLPGKTVWKGRKY